jgi:TolB-like protein/class 3 adenylate cyclase/tetratricopeptide (TPR) repeat protein
VTDARVERRLAAILAADVVGFSALMERDEEGTYARVGRLRREVIEPRLSEHQGRLIKTTGDGFLAEFASPIAALRCALAIQGNSSNAPDALRLRIGLNLGDVIIEQGGDVYGEGVNVAARLEALADANGILISDKIHREVEGKVEAAFEDRGEQQVKNITRPIRIYAVRSAGATSTSAATILSQLDPGKPLPLPDKPSIAVLPFQNMSGDPEQEYFADGIVEDVITALSRFKSLFVIARNSSFAYKGKSPDIRQVGRELGVRYVLEGSVRKAGSRLRITAQLIDADSGAHTWADRFEGSLEDVFALQDEVTEKVVVAIAPRVERAEMARAKRRHSSNTDAYDCYLRGLACLSPLTPDNIEQALGLFVKAAALDPDYASAYGMAMVCHANRAGFGVARDLAAEKSEVARLWPMVVRVGQDDGVALAQAAWGVAYVLRDLSSAKQLIDRALGLNSNLASAWANSGWINVWLGQPELALEHLGRAGRLDPGSISHFSAMAHAYFFLDRHEEALAVAEQMVRYNPQMNAGLRIGTASAAFAGHRDTARMLAARLQAIDPAFRVSRLNEYLGPYQQSAFVDKYAEGLRLSGLPE